MGVKCVIGYIKRYNRKHMTGKRIAALAVIVASVLLAWFIVSSERTPGHRFAFKQGLDLKGGVHLVYKADTSGLAETDIEGSMDALRDTIERRINVLGVSEPVIQVENAPGTAAPHRLIVELPGVTDIGQALDTIGKTPFLEFKLVNDEVMSQLTATTSPTSSLFAAAFASTSLKGEHIVRADVVFQPTTNRPAVTLTFSDQGKEIFAKLTRENVGRSLAIFLDGQLMEAPVINEEIRDGKAEISGSYDVKTARELSRNISYGALPVPISLLSTESIGPSLGEQAVAAGILAGILAFVIVSIFLIVWYRLPGVVAVVALAVYVIVSLVLFKLLAVTLTAAGIAGFILSIGMAVDANILIFERLREELAHGHSLKDAMELGFQRAWLSIRDSNISSLITAIILYMFASTSVIAGFAFVFALGVLVSMFSAITVTRTFLYALGIQSTGKGVRFLFSSGFKKQ